MKLLRWIDIPPVWLCAALIATWWLGELRPYHLSFGGNWTGLPGGLLVGGGLILMGLAVVEMRKWRTTIVPHRDAGRLVTSGIFKRSRNPIYLGDALVLTGMIFYWDVPIALPLIPIFIWIIERRFILPEEDRLRTKFREDFFRYSEKTRRWV